jgi:hypothetical protein
MVRANELAHDDLRCHLLVICQEIDRGTPLMGGN